MGIWPRLEQNASRILVPRAVCVLLTWLIVLSVDLRVICRSVGCWN